MKSEKWPNFFIVGAPKAGTTSLYYYLKDIPGVFLSPVKEPHFFSDTKHNQYKMRDKRKYLDLFKNSSGEIAIGEASTSYLFFHDSPKRIQEKVPNPKIIISLRDPVEQFVSGYTMNFRKGFIKKDIHNFINGAPILNFVGNVTKSFKFSTSVNRYIDTFGKESVKVIIFEEFIQNPQETVQDILKFLGVDYVVEKFDAKIYNSAENPIGDKNLLKNSMKKSFGKYFDKTSAKPELLQEDRQILIDHFKDEVLTLENMLGRKLPWKNFAQINSDENLTSKNLNNENNSTSILELNKEEELEFEKNLIWVFGSSRGGTTWLGSQLLSHQTKIIFEPRIARFFGDRRMWTIENRKKVDLQTRNRDYFFSDLTKKAWVYFLRKLILNRIYFQHPKISNRVLLKEPLEKGGSDFITTSVPNSKFVIIIRDGRDIIDSKIDAIKEENSWGTKALHTRPLEKLNRLNFIRTNSKNWVELVDDLVRTYQTPPKNLRYLIKYEDLRSNTLDELKKIYKFLDIEITPQDLENIVTKFDFENIPTNKKGSGKFFRSATPGGWENNFSDEEKKLMHSIMGESLKLLGYTVP